ncbi:hypothetical protein Tco_1131421 [Tanacetum coccineum]
MLRHSLTTIQTFYHGLDDPTQGILNAKGIFLYKTLNKAFQILEKNVLLKLDFSKECHIKPNPKTVVSAGEININSGHEILTEEFRALSTKINSEFMKIKGELKEIYGDRMQGPNCGSGGKFDGRFSEHCSGNGRIGGSMSGVGEGKDESMGGIGGGLLDRHSMVSND